MLTLAIIYLQFALFIGIPFTVACKILKID